jgi:hypothetical protein
MARNANIALTDTQALTVALFSQSLFLAIGGGLPHVVTYTKRDGTPSTAVGVIDPMVKGLDSTLAISVDTVATKGRLSTVNVWAITGITPA